MDQIQHKYVDIRGVKLHIAEIGTGLLYFTPRVFVISVISSVLLCILHHILRAGSSVLLFIHGFPEIWYSWRHQMIAAAKAGYRAVAPDLRGYGFSEHDSELENASFDDFVDDTVAILDHFKIEKVFLVGKDFGSWPVYLLSLLHPNRVSGIVSLGVPFFPPNPDKFKSLPEGFYITRWKEPGQAEAVFGRFDVETVWKNIYILFSSSEIPIAEKDKEIMDMVDPSTPLPPWLTKEDLATYATYYQKSGFVAPLQVSYRSLHKEFTINNPKIRVPVMLIMGGKDYILKFPGIEEYITSGEVQEYVPDLEVKKLPEGTHFVQEQFPDHVNQLILSFLNKHV